MVGAKPREESVEQEPIRKSTFREYAEAITVALILALFIRTFVFQAFKIPSTSMMDTLMVGDHIIVNKFIYGSEIPFVGLSLIPLKDPAREDIVVFKYPEDPQRDFIKRVIGLPEETIRVLNKAVYIDGKKLPDEHAKYSHRVSLPRHVTPKDDYGPARIPVGHYFVMGDNRDNSQDSRFWHFLPHRMIKGKAFVIYWSWDTTERSLRWDRFLRKLH